MIIWVIFQNSVTLIYNALQDSIRYNVILIFYSHWGLVILGINDLLQSYMGRNSMLNAALRVNIYCVICTHMGDWSQMRV